MQLRRPPPVDGLDAEQIDEEGDYDEDEEDEEDEEKWELQHWVASWCDEAAQEVAAPEKLPAERVSGSRCSSGWRA